ncbi:MAG: caspase family protein [Nitrospiraceae bacterium]
MGESIPNLFARLGLWIMTALVVCPFGAFLPDFVQAASRGASPAVKAIPGEVTLEGEYWALIIGIDEYQAAPKLKTAVSDASAIRRVLMDRYGFKADRVRFLINGDATRSRIEGAFVKLAKEAGPNDSVLIYYAGHGQYSDDNQLAWWVPVEASLEEPGTWILDAAIRNYVAAMRARHVYVIADSCFSGNLFAQTRAIIPPMGDRYYAKLYAKRSRWGLTSGSTEPVADQGKDGHSVFAYHLIKFLNENDEPYLVPSRIADHVIPLVARNAEQMPRSQPLQGANDEGGQFVLQLSSLARGLEEQGKQAEESLRRAREQVRDDLKQELDRLAEERRRLELEAKDKLEKERAHLLELERQLEKQRRDEADVKRQLEEEHRQRVEAERQAAEARKGGEAAEQAAKQQAARDQREVEVETQRKLAEERRQRVLLERQLAEQRQRETETKKALEQEQSKRQEAERLANQERVRGIEPQPESKPEKSKRAPFVGGF